MSFFFCSVFLFFFQAEDGIRDRSPSRGLGDVYKRQVRNFTNGRVDFTSQNHGYAVSAESIVGTNLEITHEEINDHTVEGVRLKNRPAFSVQFHPDAAPGPHDAEYLFDQFLEMIAEEKKGASHA